MLLSSLQTTVSTLAMTVYLLNKTHLTHCFTSMPNFGLQHSIRTTSSCRRSSLEMADSTAVVINDNSSTSTTNSSSIAATSFPKRKQNKTTSKRRVSKGKVTSSSTDGTSENKNGTTAKQSNISSSSSTRKKSTKQQQQQQKQRPPKRKLLPLTSLKLGSTIPGTITEIAPFGAFVKTKYFIRGNGLALIHKSQIRNDHVSDVSDVLTIGQKVNARVITIDFKKSEVGLSLRPSRPPRSPLDEISVGMEIEGRVKRIMDYGAFVDIGCVNDALLHVSRISMNKVDNIEDYVTLGQKVTVRIIDVDEEKRVIAASMLNKIADAYLDRRRRNKPL